MYILAVATSVLALPAQAEDCQIDARLESITKQAAAAFIDRGHRVVAVVALEGGAATPKLRQYATREAREFLSGNRAFRTEEEAATNKAVTKAKLVGATTLTDRKVDKLGDVSRIDGLLGLRFEQDAGDGIIIRAEWRSTHPLGRIMGKTKKTVCASARLAQLLESPPPVAVAPPPVAVPPPPVAVPPPPPEKPVAPPPPPRVAVSPPPSPPPAPAKPTKPAKPTVVPAPPAPTKPPAVVPAIGFDGPRFRMRVAGCYRTSGAGLTCRFTVAARERDGVLALNAAQKSGWFPGKFRTFAYMGSDEHVAASIKLGSQNPALYLRKQALPVGVPLFGEIRFTQFKAAGDAVKLLNIGVLIKDEPWTHAAFENVPITTRAAVRTTLQATVAGQSKVKLLNTASMVFDTDALKLELGGCYRSAGKRLTCPFLVTAHEDDVVLNMNAGQVGGWWPAAFRTMAYADGREFVATGMQIVAQRSANYIKNQAVPKGVPIKGVFRIDGYTAQPAAIHVLNMGFVVRGGKWQQARFVGVPVQTPDEVRANMKVKLQKAAPKKATKGRMVFDADRFKLTLQGCKRRAGSTGLSCAFVVSAQEEKDMLAINARKVSGWWPAGFRTFVYLAGGEYIAASVRLAKQPSGVFVQKQAIHPGVDLKGSVAFDNVGVDGKVIDLLSIGVQAKSDGRWMHASFKNVAID